MKIQFKKTLAVASVGVLALALQHKCLAASSLPLQPQPSAANTGPSDVRVLVPTTGSITARSGETIQNCDLLDGQIKATNTVNVTIRNCRINANGRPYAIQAKGAKNLVIENVELYNMSSSGIMGDGFSVKYANIHHSGGDGVKPNHDAVIAYNWMHHLGYNAPGAHADGVQIRGGANFLIFGNFFDMGLDVPNTHSNSSLLTQAVGSDHPSNIVFESNWSKGGNYTLHLSTDGGKPTTCKVLNNQFYKGTARYGFATLEKGVVWTGNVFAGTKTAVTVKDK